MPGDPQTKLKIEREKKIRDVVTKVLFTMEITDKSANPDKNSVAFTKAQDALVNFLKRISTSSSRTGHTVDSSIHRNSHFRRLVRDFMAVGNQQLYSKGPVYYNSVTHVVTFDDNSTENKPSELMQSLIELRNLLECK